MELADALDAEGRWIDDATLGASQYPGLQFESHERCAGEGCLERPCQRGRESEAGIVVLMAENNDRLPTTFARQLEACSDQCAANPMALTVRRHCHRR